ncbi:type II toxin-antitoxin system VapC family toxin [Capilliphycus salinus ALCB114379]|uniref:type II toxin-antitoxin system VapC family toxin n=1 Tax=Capilliphycus salinus TaxID=2768948 RepID=UPI0039A5C285
MSYLCDTNIISELARPQPNPGVLNWSRQIYSIKLSVITLEEIYYGLASKPNSRIKTWFDQFLEMYCDILPITDEIAKMAGELRGKLRTQGQQRTQADMLIAATANVHQLTLATRNIHDFQDCDIQLLNPFTD